MTLTETARHIIKLGASKQELVAVITANLRLSGLSRLEAANHAVYHYKALISQIEALGFELRTC